MSLGPSGHLPFGVGWMERFPAVLRTHRRLAARDDTPPEPIGIRYGLHQHRPYTIHSASQDPPTTRRSPQDIGSQIWAPPPQEGSGTGYLRPPPRFASRAFSSSRPTRNPAPFQLRRGAKKLWRKKAATTSPGAPRLFRFGNWGGTSRHDLPLIDFRSRKRCFYTASARAVSTCGPKSGCNGTTWTDRLRGPGEALIRRLPCGRPATVKAMRQPPGPPR